MIDIQIRLNQVYVTRVYTLYNRSFVYCTVTVVLYQGYMSQSLMSELSRTWFQVTCFFDRVALNEFLMFDFPYNIIS